jgi:hypothetical protein
MGWLDRIRERLAPQGPPEPAHHDPQGPAPRDDEEVAIERYRYMLRTAPPETVEQAHAEAFAKLTPDQRRQVLADVGAAVPPAERAASDDPRALARMATRAEINQPGTMERTLGRGGGPGLGGVIAGSLLASVAGAFVGTAVADAFLGDDGGSGAEAAGGESGGDGDPGTAEYGGEYGGDPGGDMGGDMGGDVGGGFGDFGGDFSM